MATSAVLQEYEAAKARAERLLGRIDRGEAAGSTCATIEELYEIEKNPLRAGTQKTVQRALAACGVSTSDLVYVDIRPRGLTDGDAAYANWADGRNGVLICSENYKKRDTNPPEKQLFPSEVLWQSWAMAASKQGAQASNIRAIVRYCVKNEESRRILWHAARTSTCKDFDLQGRRPGFLPIVYRAGRGLLGYSGKP
ncbi:MAG: hypothetical protein Q9181_007865 [Wetmoreana brouardii]